MSTNEEKNAAARAASLRWRRLNPAKSRASCAKWAKANPEKVRARIYRWRRNNPERYKAQCRKYVLAKKARAVAEFLKMYYENRKQQPH